MLSDLSDENQSNKSKKVKLNNDNCPIMKTFSEKQNSGYSLIYDQIDIEHGDSSLAIFSYRNNHFCNVLIDGGPGTPERNFEEIINRLLHNNISKIDFAIVTHFHKDHYGGIIKILKILENNTNDQQCVRINIIKNIFDETIFIDPFLFSRRNESCRQYSNLIEARHNKLLKVFETDNKQYKKEIIEYLNKIRTHFQNEYIQTKDIEDNYKNCLVGKNLLIFDHSEKCFRNWERNNSVGLICISQNGWILKCDSAGKFFIGKGVNQEIQEESLNNQSLGFLISLGSRTIYCSGDLEDDMEQSLLKELFIPSNIQPYAIKLSHHGSITSTPKSFIQTLNPKVVLNSHGILHGLPNIDILCRVCSEVIYEGSNNLNRNEKLLYLLLTNNLDHSKVIEGQDVAFFLNKILNLKNSDKSEILGENELNCINYFQNSNRKKINKEQNDNFINIINSYPGVLCKVASIKEVDPSNRKNLYRIVEKGNIKLVFMNEQTEPEILYPTNPSPKYVRVNLSEKTQNIFKLYFSTHTLKNKQDVLLEKIYNSIDSIKGILELPESQVIYSINDNILTLHLKEQKLYFGDNHLFLTNMELEITRKENIFKLNGNCKLILNENIEVMMIMEDNSSTDQLIFNSVQLNSSQIKIIYSNSLDSFIFTKYSFLIFFLQNCDTFCSIYFKPLTEKDNPTLEMRVNLFENKKISDSIIINSAKLILQKEFVCFSSEIKWDNKYTNYVPHLNAKLIGKITIAQFTELNFFSLVDDSNMFLFQIDATGLDLLNILHIFSLNVIYSLIQKYFSIKEISLLLIAINGEKSKEDFSIKSIKDIEIHCIIILDSNEKNKIFKNCEFSLIFSKEKFNLNLKNGIISIGTLLSYFIGKSTNLFENNLQISRLSIESDTKTDEFNFKIEELFEFNLRGKSFKCDHLEGIYISNQDRKKRIKIKISAIIDHSHNFIIQISYKDGWKFSIIYKNMKYNDIAQFDVEDICRFEQENEIALNNYLKFTYSHLKLNLSPDFTFKEIKIKCETMFNFQIPLINVPISGKGALDIIQNKTGLNIYSKIENLQLQFLNKIIKGDFCFKWNDSKFLIKLAKIDIGEQLNEHLKYLMIKKNKYYFFIDKIKFIYKRQDKIWNTEAKINCKIDHKEISIELKVEQIKKKMEIEEKLYLLTLNLKSEFNLIDLIIEKEEFINQEYSINSNFEIQIIKNHFIYFKTQIKLNWEVFTLSSDIKLIINSLNIEYGKVHCKLDNIENLNDLIKEINKDNLYKFKAQTSLKFCGILIDLTVLLDDSKQYIISGYSKEEYNLLGWLKAIVEEFDQPINLNIPVYETNLSLNTNNQLLIFGLKTEYGTITISVFKGDNGKNSFCIEYDTQNTKENLDDFDLKDVNLQCRYSTNDNKNLKLIKGTSIGFQLDITKYEFTSIMNDFIKLYNNEFDGKLGFRYVFSQNEKYLECTAFRQFNIKIGFVHLKVENLKFRKGKIVLFDVTLYLKLFIDISIKGEITIENKTIIARIENNEPLNLKILPGLILQKGWFVGCIFPISSEGLGFGFKGLIHKYEDKGEFSVDLIFGPRPIPSFKIIFPEYFELTISTLFLIIFGEEFTTDLDIIKLSPLPEEKKITLICSGFDVNIKFQLNILNIIYANLNLEVDLPHTIHGEVILNKISLLNDLILISNYQQTEGPKLVLHLSRHKPYFKFLIDGLINFFGIKSAVRIKLNIEGLELKFKLKLDLGHIIKVENESICIIKPCKEIYFKNSFNFLLNLKTPPIEAFGFKIGALQLYGVNVTSLIELISTQFKIQGSFNLNIFGVSESICFNLDIDLCNISQIPGKIVEWIFENFETIIKMLGKLMIQLIYEGIKRVGDLFKGLVAIWDGIVAIGEEILGVYGLEKKKKHKVYKNALKLFDNNALNMEVFSLFVLSDEFMEKYRRENLKNVDKEISDTLKDLCVVNPILILKSVYYHWRFFPERVFSYLRMLDETILHKETDPSYEKLSKEQQELNNTIRIEVKILLGLFHYHKKLNSLDEDHINTAYSYFKGANLIDKSNPMPYYCLCKCTDKFRSHLINTSPYYELLKQAFDKLPKITDKISFCTDMDFAKCFIYEVYLDYGKIYFINSGTHIKELNITIYNKEEYLEKAFYYLNKSMNLNKEIFDSDVQNMQAIIEYIRMLYLTDYDYEEKTTNRQSMQIFSLKSLNSNLKEVGRITSNKIYKMLSLLSICRKDEDSYFSYFQNLHYYPKIESDKLEGIILYQSANYYLKDQTEIYLKSYNCFKRVRKTDKEFIYNVCSWQNWKLFISGQMDKINCNLFQAKIRLKYCIKNHKYDRMTGYCYKCYQKARKLLIDCIDIDKYENELSIVEGVGRHKKFQSLNDKTEENMELLLFSKISLDCDDIILLELKNNEIYSKKFYYFLSKIRSEADFLKDMMNVVTNSNFKIQGQKKQNYDKLKENCLLKLKCKYLIRYIHLAKLGFHSVIYQLSKIETNKENKTMLIDNSLNHPISLFLSLCYHSYNYDDNKSQENFKQTIEKLSECVDNLIHTKMFLLNCKPALSNDRNKLNSYLDNLSSKNKEILQEINKELLNRYKDMENKIENTNISDDIKHKIESILFVQD